MLPGDRDAYDRMQRDKFIVWGVEQTRRALNEGKLGERKGSIARAWLIEQDAATDAEQREIDREIARGANRIAAQARTRSTWANVIALAAFAAAMRQQHTTG